MIATAAIASDKNMAVRPGTSFPIAIGLVASHGIGKSNDFEHYQKRRLRYFGANAQSAYLVWFGLDRRRSRDYALLVSIEGSG